MRLTTVRLSNFRCYKDDFTVPLAPLTVLIGKNDCGKSAVFDALSIFFQRESIEAEDLCVQATHKEIRIVCEFDDLTGTIIIDRDHSTTLAEEYLINENGHLEIHQVWDCKTKKPSATYYARAMHPSKSGHSDLLTLKNAELKARAKDLAIDTTNINLAVNSALRKAIWGSVGEATLALTSTLVPLDTTHDVWSQLSEELPLFQLFRSDRPSTDQDAEAQDPMKAAVSEAMKDKQAELRAVEEYVKAKVNEIAAATVEKLKEMDPALAKQLHPEFGTPKWNSLFKFSLTDGDQIPMNKRGSGVRRLLLLSFFRAQADRDRKKGRNCGVIYAVEEPETSQHPNYQRMILDTFQELVDDDPHCQVLLTTHSPMLARLLDIETIRYIEVGDNGRLLHVGSATSERTLELAADALGILADHNIEVFIGVEGPTDIDFLKNVSRTLVEAGEDLPDLDALESDGRIMFVPLGGSNLAYWTMRLRELHRPEFYLFDRDTVPPQAPNYQTKIDEINAAGRPNVTARSTGKLEIENYIHPDAIDRVEPGLGLACGPFDDVPVEFAKAVHQKAGGNPWGELEEDDRRDKVRRTKKRLNRDAARCMTVTELNAVDSDGEVRRWLSVIKDCLRRPVSEEVEETGPAEPTVTLDPEATGAV